MSMLLRVTDLRSQRRRHGGRPPRPSVARSSESEQPQISARGSPSRLPLPALYSILRKPKLRRRPQPRLRRPSAQAGHRVFPLRSCTPCTCLHETGSSMRSGSPALRRAAGGRGRVSAAQARALGRTHRHRRDLAFVRAHVPDPLVGLKGRGCPVRGAVQSREGCGGGHRHRSIGGDESKTSTESPTTAEYTLGVHRPTTLPAENSRFMKRSPRPEPLGAHESRPGGPVSCALGGSHLAWLPQRPKACGTPVGRLPEGRASGGDHRTASQASGAADDVCAAADALKDRQAKLSRRGCRRHAQRILDLERSLDMHESLYRRVARV